MEREISDLGDASFSYLRAAGNLTKNLTEPVQFPHAAAVPSSKESIVPSPSSAVEKIKPEEAEISVFGAEKYFNMKIEYDGDDGNPRMFTETNSTKNVYERDNLADLHRMRPKSRIGSPSVTSQASSNSQVAMLQSSLRNSSRKYNKKVNDRWFFAGLACNGTCTEKKSVDIDRNPAHRGIPASEFRKEAIKVARNPILMEGRKQSHQLSRFHDSGFENTSVGSNREEYYVLPTVNSGVQSLMNIKKEEQKVIEEPPRMSLEVFGNHSMRREDIAKNLERKLSVLTWDAIPKGANFLPSEDNQVCEDIASDASSDLFEIESAQPMYTKQTSDGMSSCVTPSRYAPSEASIEWSVATARAADFSSVSCHPGRIKQAQGSPVMASTPRKSRSGILLGCKSQKAVEVAETAYKRTDHKARLQHPRLDGSMTVRKMQADSKVKLLISHEGM